QAEDIRLLVSFSGIERKEIRWRKATLKEAKRVVFTFHQQMAKAPDGNAEKAEPTAPPVNAGAKMHRPAGAKIHQRCRQEGPRTGGLFFRHQAWVGLSVGVSGLARCERRLL